MALSDLKGIDWTEVQRRIDAADLKAALDYAAFDTKLRERFPDVAWMLDHEELGPIIRQAVNEEWGENTLLGKISKSQWGMDRTDAQEAWDILEGGNPEEAANRVQNIERLITDKITQMGAVVPEGFASSLAKKALRDGMTDSEALFNDFISGEIVVTSTSFEAGTFTASQQNIRELANATMIRVSEEDTDAWARKIATGEWTIDTVSETLKQRAKSKFPALADLIDRGTNLSDYFSDHRQTIANMMGESFDAIDLVGDSRWAPVLSFAEGPGKIPRPMAAHEVSRFVRSTHEYWNRPTGRQELANNKMTIRRALGLK